MHPLRCPRCHRETNDPLAAFCRACGAPIRLSDERPGPPLSAPVAIDRRADEEPGLARTHAGVVPPPLRPEPPVPRAAPPRPAARDELADLEKSHWDLGGAAPSRAEPAITAPPAPFESPWASPPAPRGERGVAPSPPAPAPSPRPAPAAARDERGAARPPPAPPPSRPPAPPAAREGTGTAARAPAPREPASAGGIVEVHVRRAEPWRRAAAWAVDGLPFVAGGIALSRAFVREAAAGVPGPATGLDLLDFVARERVIVLSVAAAMAVALAVYATLAHALAGATLGKRLLRLRVVGPDGGRPSLARSAARSALALVSAAALSLGFLLALFTRSGRALHDLVARTWVVDA